LVEDLEKLLAEIQSRHGAGPVHALGVSLGAVITLAGSILRPEMFESQILLSPGLAARVRIGLRRRLRLLSSHIMTPTALFDIPFTVDQLTDRPHWRDIFEDDPLRTRRVSARFLFETLRMQRFVLARLCALRPPVYALLAERDAIIDNDVVVRALSTNRTGRVRIEIFRGASHNLPAAVGRPAIVDRIDRWMRAEGVPQGVEIHHTELDQEVDADPGG
jgi:alpha-beta hydrolase superfamily lysophospholipase